MVLGAAALPGATGGSKSRCSLFTLESLTIRMSQWGAENDFIPANEARESIGLLESFFAVQIQLFVCYSCWLTVPAPIVNQA